MWRRTIVAILQGHPAGCSDERTRAIDRRAPINSCLAGATQPPVTCDALRCSQAADNHWALQGQLVSAGTALHLQRREEVCCEPRAVTSGAPCGRSIAMSSIHHRDTCTNLVFSPASKTFVTSQANSGVFVLRDCLRSAARVGAPRHVITDG